MPLGGGPPTRLTHQGGVNVPYGWAPDGRVVYWHSSPTEPGDLWAISTAPPALEGRAGPPAGQNENEGARGA